MSPLTSLAAMPDDATAPPARIRTQVMIPLRFADGYETTAEVTTFHGLVDGREHLALRLGEPGEVALVRPHSECMTGDVFGSTRCDCGPQLREAAERISEAGGYLLYLRQEGRGIGLYEKMDTYALQDTGLDTYAANRAIGQPDDLRDYRVVSQMLDALGVQGVDLLTNNPDKVDQLTELGVDVRGVTPTGVHLSDANRRYLDAKVRHTSHTIALPFAV